MILFIPVLKKLWKQCELWDGTYTITDLFDIVEAIIIENKNKQLIMDNEMSKLNSELDKMKSNMSNVNIR